MFESFAILVVIAALFGVALSLLGLSPSPAYLLAGFLLTLLGVSSEELSFFAEFGVIMLLFIVGLELDLGKLRKSSYRLFVVSFFQMLVAFISTYFIGGLLGFTGKSLFVLSLSFMFSSTALVLKVLFDKGLLESAVGNLVVSVLLLQDVAAAITISLFSGFHLSALGVLGLVVFLFVGKKLFTFVSFEKSTSLETLFILAVSAAIGSAAIASKIGLSAGMGALLAGIVFSLVENKHELASLMRPLKDFFLLLFFLYIGSFVNLGSWHLLWLLVVPLVITPLTVLVSSLLVKYPFRVSLLSAFSLSNLSEFSLVLVWTAAFAKVVPNALVSVVALNVLVSMLISPLLLQAVGRFRTNSMASSKKASEIVLFGAHTTGGHILREFGKDLLVIDAKPSTVHALRRKGKNAILGDVGDVSFLESLALENAKVIVSTVPDKSANLAMLEYLRSKESPAIVILISQKEEDHKHFKEKGADLIIIPKKLAGAQISKFLKGLKLKKL